MGCGYKKAVIKIYINNVYGKVMKAKILQKLLIDIQKKFGFKEIQRPHVFDKKGYQFLHGRSDAKHIVIDSHKIEIIYYSTDIRENAYYIDSFDYLDDFLLAYFRVRFDVLSTMYAMNARGDVGKNHENPISFMVHKEQLNARLEQRLLSTMGTLTFFLLNSLLCFKIQRKKYTFYLTHLTTFFAWFLLIAFWVLFFLGYSFIFLLFIAGFIFISNGYLELELLVQEYRSNQAVSWSRDRVLGIIGLIILFSYLLYFYKLI